MPAYKHGLSRSSRAYRKWTDMKSRCARDPKYTRNGITVCPEWASDFMAFYRSMGEPPEGLTLDRIDGTKGYSPDNCRWASYKEQNRNLASNVIIGGRLLADIVEETGLSRTAIAYRAAQGQPLDAPRIGERTHCKAGHEWSEANTYVTTVKRKQGGMREQRYCRLCRAEYQKKRRKQLNPKANNA